MSTSLPVYAVPAYLRRSKSTPSAPAFTFSSPGDTPGVARKWLVVPLQLLYGNGVHANRHIIRNSLPRIA